MLHGRARWMFGMGAAMVLCSALSAMLWIGLLDLSRPSIVAQTPQITPMHAALQAVFDDGLAAAGAAEYGLTHQGPLRPDGTINLVGQGGIDGQAGGFRVHKRSPFGSGVDHTMDEDGIDFIELPEVKPAKYIDPHAEQGVQWSGALVQLMEQGYAREDAQAALSSTGNDLEASSKLLLQAVNHPGVFSRWLLGGRDVPPQTDAAARLVLEATTSPRRASTASASAMRGADGSIEHDRIIVVDDEEDDDIP